MDYSSVLERGGGLSGGVTVPTWYNNLSSGVTNGINFLDNNSKALGSLGSLFSAYKKYNTGNKIFGLQKDAYNYNKMLSDEELKRRRSADANLQTAYNNSTLSGGL